MKIKQHARVALQSLVATFFVALAVVAVSSAATTIGNNLTMTAGIVDITGTSDTILTINGSSSSTTLAVYQSGAADIVNVFDGSTEVFTVLDGGNIGVGSSTPYALLSVEALTGQQAFIVGSSSAELLKIDDSGAVSFNGGGWSVADFTVQGDAQANLFQVDASADRVGIATSTPNAVLAVEALSGQNAFIVGSSTNQELFIINDSGGAIFNEGGLAEADFRVEGDSVTNLFFIDASTNRVGISSSTPQALLSVGDPQGNATTSIDVGLPCFHVMSYNDGVMLDYYLFPSTNNTLGGFAAWATSTTSCF